MTLTDARSRAKTALETAVTAARSTVGHVYVDEIDGVLNTAEVARDSFKLPAVQVSVMAREAEGIRLCVYVLTRPKGRRLPSAMLLLDTVEEALRTLPGAGRAILDVATQTLYDPAMVAKGCQAFAVTVVWPDLAAESDSSSSADGSLIADANAFLAPAVDGALGLADVDETDAAAVADRNRRRGMTELDRRRLALDGPLPYAEVRHGEPPAIPGVSRVSGAGAIERVGAGSGAARQRGNVRPGRLLGPVPAEPGSDSWTQQAHGMRVWPATVALWAGTDVQADAALTELLRLVPRRWRWSDQQNRVTVGRVVGATYVPERGAHMASAEITLRAVNLIGERTQARTVTVGVGVSPRRADSLEGHTPPIERDRYRRRES